MKSNSISAVARQTEHHRSIEIVPICVGVSFGWCGLLVACLLAAVGCGPQHPGTYPVSGKVQFDDGQPVEMGLVELRSKSKPPVNARGKIQADGRFQLGTFEAGDGAVLGDHDVIVVQVLASPVSVGGSVKH